MVHSKVLFHSNLAYLAMLVQLEINSQAEIAVPMEHMMYIPLCCLLLALAAKPWLD
jgi:hypothetical protein